MTRLPAAFFAELSSLQLFPSATNDGDADIARKPIINAADFYLKLLGATGKRPTRPPPWLP